MDNQIIITAVSENTSMHHSLLAQHGQSLHLQYMGTEYLFDVAEVYEGFIYNLSQLNIRLETIDSIVISHRHLDHTGSLPKLLAKLSSQKLYLPPDMLGPEERGYKDTYRTIDGTLFSREDAISKIMSYSNVITVTESVELQPGLFTTGSLGDDIKEQALVINVKEKGLVILVGCSHPTLPLIVNKAKAITGVDTVYGLIGGFHYKDSTDDQIATAVRFLQDIHPEFIVPSHCSYYKAIRAMQETLGEKVKLSSTGQFGTGNSVQITPELQFHLR